MKKRLTSVVVTGAIALGGLGAGLVAMPVIASATAGDPTAEATEDGTDSTEDGGVADAVGDRLTRIREALSGLVSDGTIDEAQADAVASALDEALPGRGGPGGHGGPDGHGGPGGGRGPGGGLALEEASALLGLTADELLVELQAGDSLSTVAEEQGVAVDTLVDGLVAAAEAHVAEHVEAGDVTQEQADERLAGLEEQITTLVEREDLPLRGDRGSGPTPEATTEQPSPTA